MTKYKLVGFINLFIGLLGVFFTSYYLLIVTTKLNKLYTDFGVVQNIISTQYIILFVIFVIGIIYMFVAYSLLNKNLVNKELFFRIGLVLLILSFISVPLIIGLLMMSTILPIYSITTSL